MSTQPDLRVRAKNIDAELLGERLKHARQRAGLTQTEAAGDDMSTAYISRIESGQRRPSPDLLVRLAERLGTTPEELLAPDDREKVVDADLVARLQLELDYVELHLRTGSATAALEGAANVLAEEDVPNQIGLAARALHAQALEADGRLSEAILELEDVVGAGLEGLELVRVLVALSRCYREEGDLVRACEIGDRAVDLVDEADLRGSAEGIQLAVTVAAAYFERGDVNHASRLCERAIQTAEVIGSPKARASAYWNSSIMHQRRGDIASALPLAQRAVALLEQDTDMRNITRLRSQLGMLQLQMSPPEIDGAILNLTQARMDMALTDASVVDRGRVEVFLAEARLLIGEVEEASQIIEDCLDLVAAGDSPLILAEAHNTRGKVALARHQVDVAVSEFRKAIHVLSALGADRNAAQLWFQLGEQLHEHGQLDEALDAFRRAAASTGLESQATGPLVRGMTS